MNKSSDLLEAKLEPDSAASRVGLIASWRILRFVTGIVLWRGGYILYVK